MLDSENFILVLPAAGIPQQCEGGTLADGECYEDPGPDHFTRLHPTKAKNNAINKLKSLGYEGTLTVTPAA